MLPSTGSRTLSKIPRRLQQSTRALSSSRQHLAGDNRIQTNDPSPPKAVQNVSGTNAIVTDAMGAHDAALQEMPEEAEKARQMQAPNRTTIWAPSQQPRAKAMTGPRFEQTIMHHQVSESLGRMYSIGFSLKLS